MIDNLDVDLKNLLKFKPQIRVSEDQYLNMIKSMKVKLEKDAMNDLLNGKPIGYKISMNDKELINLGEQIQLDNLPKDDEVIEDIHSQISESQNIGTFENPKILNFDFDAINSIIKILLLYEIFTEFDREKINKNLITKSIDNLLKNGDCFELIDGENLEFKGEFI